MKFSPTPPANLLLRVTALPDRRSAHRIITATIPYGLAVAAILFFARRARFGVWALPFFDETEHLLGGWALDSGERLYRNFVDLHGPCVFMLAQIYGALFGWSHANLARLVIAGLAGLAGAAVAASPALRGAARVWAVCLYFGLLATVWLVQGLYLFSTYPIAGAFAVIALALFVVPAGARVTIPAWAASAAGCANAFLAFTSFSDAPTGLLFSACSCLAAGCCGHAKAVRAHLAGALTTGLVLLGWLAVWGDIRGYLAFHVAFGMVIFPKFAAFWWGGFYDSLILSLHPDRLVQTAALAFNALAAVAALVLASQPGRGRIAAILSVLATGVAIVLLNLRALTTFQNGTFLFAGIGWFAISTVAAPQGVWRMSRSGSRPIPARIESDPCQKPLAHEAAEGGAQPVRAGRLGADVAGESMFPRIGILPACMAAASCVLVVGLTDAVLRHAIYSPPPITRAQFLSQPPAPIANRLEGPLFDAIRRITRPDERILVLVYRPTIYFAAERLPIDRLYEYLPTDAMYAKSPQLGEARDLCDILAKSPPPVIVFDNWAVWGIYRPADYMPCLFTTLAAKYTYVPEPGDTAPEASKLYVRNDRTK